MDEVLAIMEPETEMGVLRAYPLASGYGDLGMTSPFEKDRVYVQCAACRHPFDIVATVLHELGHQMVNGTLHHLSCIGGSEGHCVVWERCVKVVHAFFVDAPKPKSSTYLHMLHTHYGEHWERYLVQSATACDQCDFTVAERCMAINLRHDYMK